jgi:uncharacterized membrane protein
MRRLWRSRQQRADGERGAVLILVAIGLTMIIAASGLSVDLGRMVVVNRSLQSLADVSALDAARYLDTKDNLTTEAQAGLTENHATATETVQGGLWAGGVFTAKMGNFCTPGLPFLNAPCNAVKVTASTKVNDLFSHGHEAPTRSAIAATSPETSFSIGTYLAGVNSTNTYTAAQVAVLNLLLGSLVSPPITNFSFTAVGFSGLANTFVSIAQLISVSGGVLTPSNVMTTSLTGAGWVGLLQKAASSQAALLGTCNNTPTPYPCTANTVLTTLAASTNSTTSVTLCQLVSVNGSSCSNPSLSQLSLSASFNVLQLLSTESELAVLNGTNALFLTTALSLPGVTTAQLSFTAIQAPQIAYGPVSPSTTAKTSQISLKLVLTMASGVGVLTIPISGANGTATLTGMKCVNNAATQAAITASTTAATGSVSLLGIPVATLSASGASPPAIGFTTIPPTTTSIQTNANPVAIGTNAPVVTFGGILGTLAPSVLLLLNSTSALSTELGPLMQALGVSFAGAQVAALSADCAAVSLVG